MVPELRAFVVRRGPGSQCDDPCSCDLPPSRLSAAKQLRESKAVPEASQSKLLGRSSATPPGSREFCLSEILAQGISLKRIGLSAKCLHDFRPIGMLSAGARRLIPW